MICSVDENCESAAGDAYLVCDGGQGEYWGLGLIDIEMKAAYVERAAALALGVIFQCDRSPFITWTCVMKRVRDAFPFFLSGG